MMNMPSSNVLTRPPWIDSSRRCWARYLLPLLFVLTVAKTGNADDTPPLDWAKSVEPFLRETCYECHGDGAQEGGLNLESLGRDLRDAEVLRRWVRLHDRVRDAEMPPPERPRPPAPTSTRFLTTLHDVLIDADAPRRQSVLRRLNRVEYENTLADLFEIRGDLRNMLPEDPQAFGFDNIGDALALSPEQMEVYFQAADKALDQVFGADREPKRVNARMLLADDHFAKRSIGRLFVRTEEGGLVTFQGYWCPSVFLSGQATVDGTYRVRIQAKTYQTDQPVVMSVYGGDVVVGRGPTHLVGYYDIAPGNDWTVVEFEDYLEARGSYQMKPYNLHAPTQGPEQFVGPGLVIGEVHVEGPLEAWPPPSRAKLLGSVDPATATIDDVREIITRLLPRAFRRPIAADECDLYVNLAQAALAEGRSFTAALRVALQAILCSPDFLFREERRRAAEDSSVPTIDDFALASRLSYFLWSSQPDETLLTLAQADQLHLPEILSVQVERLLRDPKSQRFVDNFTGQWLDLREIDFTEPDRRQYPEFDEMLRFSMLVETVRFFRDVLDQDLPVTDFIDSDWSILNQRLASHYGIDGVMGQAFRRVTLPADTVRGGVLTQASVLKVTANGTNTSPVVRGVWVLENLIGRPVPPPPGNVPAIEPDIRGATTVREQLDKHRHDTSCASCHRDIDPPGFALESFDAIGGWRDWYRSLGEGERVNLSIQRRRVEYRRGPNVDPSGQLPDGREFADIREFKRLLLDDKDQVARCLTQKLLTYALGRELGFSDREAVERIVAVSREQGYGFRTLLHTVVRSDLFRGK